ncbi:hypothetical protein EDB81DRAFT_45225 [Dactylonectria macrodidyma]|uniref:Ubiquitin carboxyl-terminal hydrolase n=1 Tax=Dactylonectria macrodidyma TaxID=307937 RepID=A0A9P9JRU5_9HYPO|nr:hypothetical protein EDB81DRAFT_45225 [Dactylonectria macrodidyma]
MTSLGHSRSSSLADNRNRPMAANGVFSPPPQAGRNGGDGRPGGAPIPHIDDILAAPRDIDMNQSIRKLLESAEASLRQAEMSRDFNRPALAFKDYIRASVIAIQTIRNHRDYSSLERDHIDLARAHRSLLKRISQQDDTFARIKQDIIADNKRTGVRPVSQHAKSSQENGVSSHSRSPSKAARDVDSTLSSVNRSPTMSPRSSLNGSRAKVKPAIQPKPQALHGSAIGSARSSLSLSVTAAQEIAARFANLRGPQSSPGQDPRIKTHQIIPPKPAGPREMPMSPPRPPKIDINTNVPSLPKIPDAIYSPRGSISGETPRPPGTTRNVYNRNGSSTPSVPGTPTQQSQAQADYFAPAQSYSNILIPPTPPENTIKVPEGDFITPDQLYQAMKAKGSILVIDTRVREDFDEGHIMSSSTICIEPSILLRDNLSADQISESLVLSPNQEESLFEQRDKYDLVVFYDHDSEQVRKTPLNSEDLVLISLRRALVDFNYMRDLKNPPKILRGGIVAWVDLMGPSSLQSSTQTAIQRPKPPTKRIRSTAIERTKSKYIVKPLKPDDVKAWQETLRNDDMDTASSPNFLRSKEDFLRRFPPVAAEQESMISQESTTSQNHSHQQPAYGLSHKVDLYTDLPSPPTRPAPAMPRPSYNGLSEVANESDPYGQANVTSTNRQVARVPTKAAEQPLSMDSTKFYTGLNNPNNWCYANSTLQCFLASPGFGRELADSAWLTKYKAPKKDDEKIEQPQLMIRIVTNLFHWMNSGKFKVMKAQTLMNYSHHLYKQGQAYQPFGSDQQQDASEFLTFLLTHIDDETNTRRDRKGFVAQPDTKRQSLLQAAAEYWHGHLGLRHSIIDRYWRGLELGTVYCFECQNKTHTFATFDGLTPPVNGSLRMSLDQVLRDYTSDSVIDDFACETCHRGTRARQSLSLARMPPLLCICLKRFQYQLDNGRTKKSPAPITWDFNDTDISRYFIQPKDDLVPPTDNIDMSDPALTGPFRYETYALIVHEGPSTTSGHYTAYVRDATSHDPYAWLYCNDSSVTKVRIGSGDASDIKESVFKSGKDRVPYLIFLRRKGMR